MTANHAIAIASASLLVIAALCLAFLMHGDPMPLPPHFGPTPQPVDVRYWVQLDCCPARVSQEPVYVPCYYQQP